MTWPTRPLGEIVDILDNRRVPVNEKERRKRPGATPYYGATGQVGWIDSWLFDEELVLLGEDGAPFLDRERPKAYLVQGKSWVNNHAHVLRGKSEVAINGYLRHFLNSFDYTDIVNGTTRLKLTQGAMREIPVPLPDIEDQRRIANKLDHIVSFLDDARAHLDIIPTLLKRFRLSVLAQACSGGLTEDWRERHPSETLAEHAIEAIKHRRLAQARTPKQRADIEECFAFIEQSESEDIPLEWQLVSLDKLASFDYGTSAKSQKSGLVPVLRMGNIQKGAIDWDELVFTSDATEIAKYSLRPSTVLFNRTNSPELVGKTAIYRGEQPAIFAGYLIRINPEADLLPEYLNYCLNSPRARAWCRQVKTDGVSQSNINAQKLGKFQIQLCPLAEQDEIVRRVKTMFIQADMIEARYSKAKIFTDKLKPSVLSKAFRGEWV